VYLYAERSYKRWLQLLLQLELGALPPQLRLSLIDVKLTFSCYKVKEVYESLADVAFVMGNALLSPSLCRLKGEAL
jgi:hypothetical protein